MEDLMHIQVWSYNYGHLKIMAIPWYKRNFLTEYEKNLVVVVRNWFIIHEQSMYKFIIVATTYDAN